MPSGLVRVKLEVVDAETQHPVPARVHLSDSRGRSLDSGTVVPLPGECGLWTAEGAFAPFRYGRKPKDIMRSLSRTIIRPYQEARSVLLDCTVRTAPRDLPLLSGPISIFE